MRPRSVLLTAAALVLASVLTGCTPTSPETPCRVTDKDRTTGQDGASVYRVYSTCGVFNVEDAPLLGAWNAADTYGRIQVGKLYLFETYGFRNGFVSAFPNIVSTEEVFE